MESSRGGGGGGMSASALGEAGRQGKSIHICSKIMSLGNENPPFQVGRMFSLLVLSRITTRDSGLRGAKLATFENGKQ